MIHYDLKPQNILFHKNEVKVSDFGLCKVLENEETRLGTDNKAFIYFPRIDFPGCRDLLVFAARVLLNW